MAETIRRGVIDEPAAVRLASVYVESLRRLAAAESEVYHAGVEMPLLRSGAGERRSMEMASEIGVEFMPLLDQAVFAAYRRQQELAWTEHQIEHIEQAVGSAGISSRPDRPRR
jgi:hypothetical protein